LRGLYSLPAPLLPETIALEYISERVIDGREERVFRGE
jgi:hypothetical protein